MQIEPVSMPKIDLHCHLDGSLSPAFIRNTLGMSTLEDSRLCAPKDCQSLAEYLTCFDLPVSCLQEKQHIREAIVDVVSQAAAENVRYLEIRFAPMLSVNSSLSLSSVVQEAVYGCQKAFDRFGVFTNLILCTMRHHTQEQNLHVLRCAREFLGAGVCAIDLAGDEAGKPNGLVCLSRFIPVNVAEAGMSNLRSLMVPDVSDTESQPSRIPHSWKHAKKHTLVSNCARPRTSRRKPPQILPLIHFAVSSTMVFSQL